MTQKAIKINDEGRVTIPAEIRDALKIKANDILQISADTETKTITINPTIPRCTICGEPVIEFSTLCGKPICNECRIEAETEILIESQN